MKSFMLILVLVVFQTQAEDLRLLDLEPNEAQKLIEEKDTSLKYAPKVDSNVPAVRFIGNDPQNVLEDIYLANQYHGQDGLGGYLYGYAVPDIAKTERKIAGGDLRGSYNYISGDGQEIKVEYWDNGDGFHQTDNVPKILPKQIEDLPEVKAAKEEHLRLWQEIAERNSHPVQDPYASQDSYNAQQASNVQAYNNPGPNYNSQPQQEASSYNAPQEASRGHPGQGYNNQQNPYASQGSSSYNVQEQASNVQAYNSQPQQGASSYSAPQEASRSHPGQGYNNQQNLYASQGASSHRNIPSQNLQNQGHLPNQFVAQQQPNIQTGSQDYYSGQYSENSNSYQTKNPQQKQQQGGEEEEPQGPPRGFFYNFDYPVGIIVQKQGGVQQKRAVSNSNLQGVYEENKAKFQQQLAQGSGSSSGYLMVH